MTQHLVSAGQDWTWDSLYEVYEEIEKISNEMGGYNIYSNQVEVITAEQMLDAYASVGLPVMYKHWSFGKHFISQERNYKQGNIGLAYEIVINTNPCIVYIMEQNDLIMQSLVLAHAGIGHNHFFKNNYLFKERTNAKNIIDYLSYARKFIEKCEEKFGNEIVEAILDAAHSLADVSIFRYKRKEPLSLEKEIEKRIAKAIQKEQDYDEIWNTLPVKKTNDATNEITDDILTRQKKYKLPEENILYFIEKHGERLTAWQKEILRIVRNIREYFYPQSQTKVMNEGCATWTHYNILNRMYDKGLINDGAMIEFLKSHSSVVFQPTFDDPRYSGMNPYSLGFEMMNDIVRICDNPTEEDKYWFADFAGCKDSFNVLKDTWANYRDESFIRQFLSPHLIRKYRFFSLQNKKNVNTHYTVKQIHNERGYEDIRNLLADEHDISHLVPDINIIDVDLQNTRRIILNYDPSVLQKNLYVEDLMKTMQNLSNLWGYDACIFTETPESYIRGDYISDTKWFSFSPELDFSDMQDNSIVYNNTVI